MLHSFALLFPCRCTPAFQIVDVYIMKFKAVNPKKRGRPSKHRPIFLTSPSDCDGVSWPCFLVSSSRCRCNEVRQLLTEYQLTVSEFVGEQWKLLRALDARRHDNNVRVVSCWGRGTLCANLVWCVCVCLCAGLRRHHLVDVWCIDRQFYGFRLHQMDLRG